MENDLILDVEELEAKIAPSGVSFSDDGGETVLPL